jgi:hypothetical protein
MYTSEANYNRCLTNIYETGVSSYSASVVPETSIEQRNSIHDVTSADD